jgi:hypothetical protein
MTRKTKYIQYKEQILCVNYDEVTLEKASLIDYNSYKENSFSSLKEVQNLFDILKITITQNEVPIKFDNVNTLDFVLCMIIYNAIKTELFLSKQEFADFTKECVDFLSDATAKLKMPYELLLAIKLINKEIVLSINELNNLNVKNYEKIEIAKSIIKKQVNPDENIKE